MKFSKMSPQEAERLARRDRNRLIAMTVLVALVGIAYLVARGQSASQEQAAADRFASEMGQDRPTDQDRTDDIFVPPFEDADGLAGIADATEAERETLDETSVDATLTYAKLVSADKVLRAMGRRDYGPEVAAELEGAPGDQRLAPLRVRGRVLTAQRQPRRGADDAWAGTLEALDGTRAHFIASRAPMRANGLRSVTEGDYLRIDGLFHSLYSSPVEAPDGSFETITAPLVVGRSLVAAPPPVSDDAALLTPALASVVDDSIDDVLPESDFDEAYWQLMAKAQRMAETVDWDTAPELSSELLKQLFENGDELRGAAVRIPVSINMDTYSKSIDDNPLGLERITEGWIGNMTWLGPVKMIRWRGPFERSDMVRTPSTDDPQRYVTGRGFFFRNHVYKKADGQPARAPEFVLTGIDVFQIQPDVGTKFITYIVLGGTVLMIAVIFTLLLADRKRSRKLYEDMVRRKRARRGSAPETPATPA
ncbi:MAG: hypothetical protein AAFU73_17290 [Planctomycetota bacterium]